MIVLSLKCHVKGIDFSICVVAKKDRENFSLSFFIKFDDG